MFKKLTSMVMAGVMALSVMASVTAADINQSGGSGDSKVTLDIGSRSLKVTVPSVLPIWVDSDNNVTVAMNAKIQNRSEGPVDVTDVSVEADNNWSLVSFNTDFSKVPVDTKQYGMTMYNDDVIDGVDLSLFDRIDGSDEIAVVYDGNVAIQSSDINKLDIGHVVFTVAWADGPRLGINDITYNVENTTVQSYMAQPDYDSNDYSYTYVTSSVAGGSKPAGGELEVPADAVSITVRASDGKNFTKAVSGDTFMVDSLLPNETYDYQMKDAAGAVVKQGKIYPTGRLRMINGGSVNNVRDLGGWSADGGKLKYGILYRGAALNDITVEEQAFFKDFLGVQAELNLRGPSEDPIDQSWFGSDIDWLNVAAGSYSVCPHYDSTNSTVDSMNKALRFVLAELREGKPIYIHCAAGKDRTATIAFILEAICGVSQSDMDRDYELAFDVTRNRSGHETIYPQDAWKKMIAQLEDECAGDNVRDRVIRALLTHGITISEINELRNLMIDGTPAQFTDEDIEVFDKTSVSLKSRLKSDGSVVPYTSVYGDGGTIAVTDFIPIEQNDSIIIRTDLPQTGNYHCQMVYYDENYNMIFNNMSGNDSSSLAWDDARTTCRVDVARVIHNHPVAKPAKYMRICIGYKNIDNVSMNIHRY